MMFDPSDSFIAVGTQYGMVYVYHLGTGLLQSEIHSHAGDKTPVTSVR